MSKRYIQTKLSFSQSSSKKSPKKKPHPYRRSQSDSSAKGKGASSMSHSYAEAAGRGTGRGRGFSDRPSSAHSSTGHYGSSSHHSTSRHPGTSSHHDALRHPDTSSHRGTFSNHSSLSYPGMSSNYDTRSYSGAASHHGTSSILGTQRYPGTSDHRPGTSSHHSSGGRGQTYSHRGSSSVGQPKSPTAPPYELRGTSHTAMEPGSPDLFGSDDEESTRQVADAGTSSYFSKTVKKAGSATVNDASPKGIPLDQLRKAPGCYNSDLPQLRATVTHKVLFRVPPKGWHDSLMIPYPNEYVDKWDDDHVYMPCSPKNVIPSQYDAADSRWKRIELELSQSIPGIFELEEAILSYNQHYAKRWTFDSLREYFLQDKARRDHFFTHTLPFMQKLALSLPSLVTQPVPILKQDHPMKLTLSQQQAACLLAHAFFCTFPKRNARVRSAVLPDINFSNLYRGSYHGDLSRKMEKLKCIFNYFERIREKMPTGIITYTRQVLNDADMTDWKKCRVSLADLHVSAKGNIEDDGGGMLQADFANKYIGGGVLGHGLVQEEIRFAICPEMILARLFTQVLQDDEVLIMTGCERFSSYTGYANTFQYAGDYKDPTPRDSWGRMYTEVVAMDALSFKDPKAQFEEQKILRELNKAYCAFKGSEFSSNLPAICTGNWGCGAFRGDKHVKALIQLMAASVAGRQMCYFTFDDKDLCSQLGAVQDMLCKNSITVKEVYKLISDYGRKMLGKHNQYFRQGGQSLFEFVASSLGETLAPASPGGSSTLDPYTDAHSTRQGFKEEDSHAAMDISTHTHHGYKEEDFQSVGSLELDID